MTHSKIVQDILTETAHGDNTTLKGMLFYLVYDLHLPLYRVADIALRRFGIPIDLTYSTFNEVL